jgi:protoporphyrinogen oxidase
MKTVILGGGPSGLGVAWGLVDAGQKDIIIVEKAAQLGGLSGSFNFAGAIVDYGPHRLSPEYADIVQKAKALLGEELLEVPNDHAVVFKNRVYRYPPVIIDFLNLSTVISSLGAVSSFLWNRLTSLFIKKPKFRK